MTYEAKILFQNVIFVEKNILASVIKLSFFLKQKLTREPVVYIVYQIDRRPFPTEYYEIFQQRNPTNNRTSRMSILGQKETKTVACAQCAQKAKYQKKINNLSLQITRTVVNTSLRREGGSRAKKIIFLPVYPSYSAIFLFSKMGLFFFQLAAVFILRTEK